MWGGGEEPFDSIGYYTASLLVGVDLTSGHQSEYHWLNVSDTLFAPCLWRECGIISLGTFVWMNLWFPSVVILAGIVAYVCVRPGPGIFEQDIVLNQQAMRCFRFVTDFNRYPSWLDSVKAVTSDVDPSSVMVGTEFELLFSRNYVGKARAFLSVVHV